MSSHASLARSLSSTAISLIAKVCAVCSYDAKRGCVRFVDLKKTGETCPLDHVHCHACGEEGHIALDCARGTAWLWAAVKAEDAAAAKE